MKKFNLKLLFNNNNYIKIKFKFNKFKLKETKFLKQKKFN